MTQEEYENKFSFLDYIQILLIKAAVVSGVGVVLAGVVLKVSVAMFHWAIE